MEVNLFYNLIFIKAYNDVLGVHSVPIYACVCSNAHMKINLSMERKFVFIQAGWEILIRVVTQVICNMQCECFQALS